MLTDKIGIFKAYDVRGRYPDEINEAAVKEIVSVLVKKFGKKKIVVGHDARLSSKSLYKAILNGITNNELRIKYSSLPRVVHNSRFVIHSIGQCSTPMFYFWCHKLKLPGIMVTASHNPKEFNGLKVVGTDGSIISGTEIKKWIPAHNKDY